MNENSTEDQEMLLFSPKKTPKSEVKQIKLKIKTPDIFSPKRSRYGDKTELTSSLINENDMNDVSCIFRDANLKKSLKRLDLDDTKMLSNRKKVKSNPSTPTKNQKISERSYTTSRKAKSNGLNKDLASSDNLYLKNFFNETIGCDDIRDGETAQQTTFEDIATLDSSFYSNKLAEKRNLDDLAVIFSTPLKQDVAFAQCSTKKTVKFGPPLSPEIFDKNQPSSTPLKKGTCTPKKHQTPDTNMRSLIKRTQTLTEFTVQLHSPEERDEVIENEQQEENVNYDEFLATPFADNISDSQISEMKSYDNFCEARSIKSTPKEGSQFVDLVVPVAKTPTSSICERSQKPKKSIDYVGVKSLLKTPNVNSNSGKSGVTAASGAQFEELKGVRELFKSPKSCAAVSFDGIQQLLKSPDFKASSLNLIGLKELLKSPGKDILNIAALESLQSMLRTPKVRANITGSLKDISIPESDGSKVELSPSKNMVSVAFKSTKARKNENKEAKNESATRVTRGRRGLAILETHAINDENKATCYAETFKDDTIKSRLRSRKKLGENETVLIDLKQRSCRSRGKK